MKNKFVTKKIKLNCDQVLMSQFQQKKTKRKEKKRNEYSESI